jgi:YD repeat-containing protein
MKIQTIHTNALGRVLNETNATGFRITDDQGRVVEVTANGKGTAFKFGATTITDEFLIDLIQQTEQKYFKGKRND